MHIFPQITDNAKFTSMSLGKKGTVSGEHRQIGGDDQIPNYNRWVMRGSKI